MLLAPALILFFGLTVAALVAAEGRARTMFFLAKPLATLSLAFVLGLPPDGLFGGLILAGIVASAVGDLILLSDAARPLRAGIAVFLLAHLSYAAAFWTCGGAGPWRGLAPLGLAVMAVATSWLLRRLWPRVEPGVRVPLLIYGVVITGMVGSSFFLFAGTWPDRVALAATAGAVLFYASDAILAWRLFHTPSRGLQTTGLTFYWAGQLGIALAGHFASGLS